MLLIVKYTAGVLYGINVFIMYNVPSIFIGHFL